MHWFLPKGDSLGFVRVDAGTFLMGSDDLTVDESPLHKVSLPEFWISRYPITVAQFRAYAEESGNKKINASSLISPDDYPVVYVSWKDGLRYCEWLTEKLVDFAKKKSKNNLFLGVKNRNLQVTLPSEAEWEKAARGMDGRVYPWGDEFDPQNLNIDETGIGSTSPVGSFPKGASPYGTLDMAGNVWEWTRSSMGEWDAAKSEFINKYKYPYNSGDGREDLSKPADFMRVIRGGSFAHDRTDTPCAYRGWDQIEFMCDTIGFRVVISNCATKGSLDSG